MANILMIWAKISNFGLAAVLLLFATLALPATSDSVALWLLWGCLIVLTVAICFNATLRQSATAVDWSIISILCCMVCMTYFWAFVYTQTQPTALDFASALLNLCALFSLLWLGGSMSILPAVRELKTRGPYGVVRHPAYAFYMFSDALFVAANPSLVNGAVLILAIVAIVCRTSQEERLLSAFTQYQVYCRIVKYRFWPGVL